MPDKWRVVSMLRPGVVPNSVAGTHLRADPLFYSIAELAPATSPPGAGGVYSTYAGDGSFYQPAVGGINNAWRVRGHDLLTVDCSVRIGTAFMNRVGSLGLSDEFALSFTLDIPADPLGGPHDPVDPMSKWAAISPGSSVRPDYVFTSVSNPPSWSPVNASYLHPIPEKQWINGTSRRGNVDTVAPGDLIWREPAFLFQSADTPIHTITHVAEFLNVNNTPATWDNVDLDIYITCLGNSAAPIREGGVFYFGLAAVLTCATPSPGYNFLAFRDLSGAALGADPDYPVLGNELPYWVNPSVFPDASPRTWIGGASMETVYGEDSALVSTGDDGHPGAVRVDLPPVYPGTSVEGAPIKLGNTSPVPSASYGGGGGPSSADQWKGGADLTDLFKWAPPTD